MIANKTKLEKIAQTFAKEALPKDTFLLHGDLGTGKTTFAQAFIKTIYPNTVVTSPTFPICHEYEKIVHYDLYRINFSEELYHLDLEEHLNSRICLIEWPERLGTLTPYNVYHIYFNQGTAPNNRNIFFEKF